ncbi:MAG: LysR family transcriptional regulator [Pseudomonadota bacterium]
MTPAAIRYFLEIVRSGSLREASERLNVAASALSRQMRKLEHEAGMDLFERGPRGMVLTSAGEAYARYARAVALEHDRIRAELAEIRGMRRGTVRVASVEGLVADVLTRAIAGFLATHRGMQVKLTTLGTDDVIAAVRDGEADLGISFHARADAAVRCLRRVRDPLVVVVHPAAAPATRRRLTLNEMFEQPLALPEPGFGIRRLVDEEARRLGLVVKPVLETNSIEALRSFARSGAGVSLLPRRSCGSDAAAGRVVALPMAEPALCGASTDLSVLAGRHLPGAVRAFVHRVETALTTPDGTITAD